MYIHSEWGEPPSAGIFATRDLLANGSKSDHHSWQLTKLSLAAAITAAVTRVKPLISRIRSACVSKQAFTRYCRFYNLSETFGPFFSRFHYSGASGPHLPQLLLKSAARRLLLLT